VACVIGDGEAETGPLAGSWQANKFLHPVNDGTVLPVLHLNGYKIANSTVMARIPQDELLRQLEGHGHRPYVVEGGFDGEDPMVVHERMASTLDEIVAEIARIRAHAKEQFDAEGRVDRPRWPMLVLRTPKGWTGPHEVDGKLVEGTWRAHQVPLSETRDNDAHRAQLEQWLRSYRPDELFDGEGRLVPALRALAPQGAKRMSATPHANGGEVLRDLRLPDFTDYAVDVPEPGSGPVGTTAVLGTWLRDVIRMNPDNFRMVAPDETASNRLQAVFEATDRQFVGESAATDEGVSQVGRVTEVLSEHLCQG
jgi:xylulose-5-phosphate/fructose-6-phosphate phosphoketolase